MATVTIIYICLAKKQQSSGDGGCRKSSDFGDGASTASGDRDNQQYISEGGNRSHNHPVAVPIVETAVILPIAPVQ